MTMTAHKNIDELVEDFALFDDWEDRYRYLIDLGRTLPHMDEALKVDVHLVKGCTSRVWLFPQIEGDVFHFIADSDAHIVRGLIALLVGAYDGKKLSEISDIDIEADFKRIGLDQHLSPNRRNGFFSMVERIQAIAENQ